MDPENIKWPIDFPELQRMDSAFKCGICYDYMKTSMITICAHTYCSICIRKFLQYSTKCPTCFIETHENDLRNNRPLDNIIMLYLEVKSKLLRALRVAEVASRSSVSASSSLSTNQLSQSNISSTVTPKSGRQSCLSTSSARNQSEKTPSAKSRLFAPESPSMQRDVSLEDIPESLDCKVPLMFTSSKPSAAISSKNKAPIEMAQCPVCLVDIPSRNINLHLDACLVRSSSSPEKEGVQIKKRDPLPKRLYHLMNDRVLKQELKSHGLNVQGDRKILLSRIRRFAVIYNSETDVDNPRPVSALIQQLDREEKEEKKKDNPLFKSLSQKVDRYSNPDAISKANKQYIEDNKDSFKRMIKDMRARNGRSIKPTTTTNLIQNEDNFDELNFVETASHLETPSTSAVGMQNLEELSKDSAQGSSLLDNVDNDNNCCLNENNKGVESEPSSPNPSQLLSESSVDSVFDFTPNRSILMSSSLKKSVKRKISRSESRSPTPDPFNDTSSVVSGHCLPEADLYQSIFGDDENNGLEICRSSDSIADKTECSPNNKSPGNLDVGYSAVENRVEPSLTPVQMRSKRKQHSIPTSDETEPLAVRRSLRKNKKSKSSPS